MPIDYARAKTQGRKLKSQLTRAVNSGDVDKIRKACKDAVTEWNRPDSAVYDDWSNWQRALDDAKGWSAPYEDIFDL